MSFFLSLVLLLQTDLQAGQLSKTALGSGLTADVDRVFAASDKADSPGCAVGIVHQGKLVYQKGYGQANLEQNVPINPSTVFYIASTSKQFTATTIALLAKQDKLSLDDDIRKYLPELPEYDSTLLRILSTTHGTESSDALAREANLCVVVETIGQLLPRCFDSSLKRPIEFSRS